MAPEPILTGKGLIFSFSRAKFKKKKSLLELLNDILFGYIIP